MSVGDRVADPVASDRSEPVLYQVLDTGVAVLTLNRPERMNGWGGGLATTFYLRLDDAEADPDVRAIVVTGTGRAFCAGADMGDLTSISAATVDAAAETDVGKLVGARHPHFATTMSKPVIAAINGACAGMGMTMALMCDVRFAADGAKFTTSFARRGLIAEYGISWILPRIVGQGVALDLLLSGRVFLADEDSDWVWSRRSSRPTSCWRGRSPTPRTSPPTARPARWRSSRTGVRRHHARCLRRQRRCRKADA